MRIFHCVVIYETKFYKRDRIMKMRLATNTDGYHLRLLSLFQLVYFDGAGLIVVEMPVEIVKWGFWRKLPLFDHFCRAPTQ